MFGCGMRAAVAKHPRVVSTLINLARWRVRCDESERNHERPLTDSIRTKKVESQAEWP